MSIHNIVYGRELIYLVCNHSLLFTALGKKYMRSFMTPSPFEFIAGLYIVTGQSGYSDRRHAITNSSRKCSGNDFSVRVITLT